MIYTVTFNPTLDYTVWVRHLQMGAVNRTEEERVYPGGKGINVSIVLKNLGLDSMALGFAAGFTGRELLRRLKEFGCQEDFIPLEGVSRINVKIKGETETDINGQGPAIPPEALRHLMGKLEVLGKDDVLVLAGSIPDTLPEDVYERILAGLQGRGVRVVVDATRDLLKNVLPYHPFLIKPNHHELGELFGRELHTAEEITVCAKKLQEQGARNVLVSMAGDGALLVTEEGETLCSPAPKGRTVNAVGAGDSMVAGFLYGYLTTGRYDEAFRMGLCAGSATAFQPWLATRCQIEQVAADFERDKPTGKEGL
ncbi:MAG: 1-phosphofructokinase [Clostridiales bacterium]|nr:1-phosphofructokinase [Clostridiales bacterium]